MDDSSAAHWPRVGAIIIVAAMVLSGIPAIKVGGAGTGSYPFEPIASAPAYTFADFAWADNGTMGMGVGNASGDGRTYRYEPRTGVWTPRAMSALEGYNGIDYLSPLNYSEGFESGTTGWTFKSWQGNLPWHRVVPTSLPTPSSGRVHEAAHGGSYDLWFGNDTTGDYNDANKIVRGSAVSPKITLSNAFSSFNLNFWHWYESEAGTTYDHKYLYVRDTASGSWTFVQQWTLGYEGWNQVAVDLTSWKGKTIQLNFTFDSGNDGAGNNYCGWHIDDLSVTSSNGAFVYVGTTTGGGFTAYSTTGYDTQNPLGSTTDFNDVAGGAKGDFLAVGPSGVAHYYNGTAWRALSGTMGTQTLTAADFNGTLFFAVGYDLGGVGVSYFIGQDELDLGVLTMHKIDGTPAVKLWGFDWSDDVAGPNGEGFGAAAGTGNVYGMFNPEKWASIPTIASPSQRYNTAMCYDTTDDIVVMFGGYAGATLGGTYEYSRNTGTWEYTSAGPTARQGARMVYAPSVGACILFGGQTGGYVGDTWFYYPNNNSWYQKFPSLSPPPRANHGMAYLDSYNVILLFGGYGGSSGYDYRNDWWVYNLATNNWVNLTTGSGPTKRQAMGFTYDSGDDRVVMFGGANATLNSQTWTYNYGSNSWVNMAPSSSPSSRVTSMVYDPGLGMSVLFGGNYGVTYYSDTWTYDFSGNRWTQVDCHAKPARRWGHGMVYDSDEGRIVMFGGTSSTLCGDTWRFTSESPWMGAAQGLDGETFYDIEYSPDGDSALMVGHNTSTNTAVIYKWSSGANGGVSKKIEPQDAELDDHILYCVEYNPTDAANSAIAVGASAFAIWPNNVQTGTVTLDVIYSHVSYIDLYDAGTSTSRLNSQIDVDPGTSTVAYDLVVRAWNVLGQNNIEVVDAYLYFDQGVETEPVPFDQIGYENTRAHFRWTRGGVPAFEMIYPGAASDYETSIILGGCTAVDDIDGLNVTLRFRFSPHQQIRYANGGGTFVQAAGTRYDRAPIGWNPEDQSTTSALDDTSSWNIHVGVTDTGGNTAHAYDEYGIYMYTYVGTAGLPGGGSVYGSGPPSTSITLSPSNQDVTCSANTIYKMHVTVTDLVGVSSLVVIPKTALSVEGGYQHPAVAFDAIGTPIYLIGTSGVWASPQDHMRTTTTSTSDWNIDMDYVIWYCSIPSVPEDRYLGTATYSVVHT